MRYSFLPAMFLAAGCTHVGTIQSGNVAPVGKGQARTGISYSLPMIQYDVTLTRMLDACDPHTLDPTFVVKASANHRYIEGERFEVDPTSLSSMFKTTSLSIERYEDTNTLKAFNAGADDKTADALVAVARIGVAAAGMAFGLPTSALAVGEKEWNATQLGEISGKTRPRILCTAATAATLAEMETAIERLNEKGAQLARGDREIARRKAVAELKSYPDALKQELINLSEAQINLGNEIDDLQVEQADRLKTISLPEQEVTWPASSALPLSNEDLVHDVDYKPGKEAAREFCRLFSLMVEEERTQGDKTFWVGLGVVAGDSSDDACAVVSELVVEASAVRLAMQSDVPKPFSDSGSVAMTVPVSDKAPNKGIFYREPIRGRLHVLTQVRPGEWNSAWSDEPQWIPQLGDLGFIRMVSGPFENEVLSLSLRKDGRLEKFSYETKEAAFARAAKAGADFGEKVQAEFEKQRKTDRDNEKYLRETAAAVRLDEIARIQAQIDLLKKQKELLEAQDLDGVAYRTQLAAIKAEIDMLTAQIARLKLTNDLEELEAKQASGG